MTVLLLTDVPPCKNFSGSLMTEEMCKIILSNENIVGAFIMDRSLFDFNYFDSDILNQIKYIKIRGPKNNISKNKYNKFIPFVSKIVISFMYEYYVNLFIIPKIIQQILDCMVTHKITKIWCILQGQTIIKIAYILQQKLNIKFYSQTWDHPSWWMLENNIDFITKNKILKYYHKILIHSDTIGASSFAMSMKYQSQNKQCSALVYGINEQTVPILSAHKPSNEILIAFCGQLYAQDEFLSFVEALNSINWYINNKIIKLIILGSNIAIAATKPCNIEFLGYRSQNEVFKLLINCDFAYCPYPMNTSLDMISKYSFPSKLVTYLYLSLPIFCHSTQSSSPASIIKHYNCGIVIDSYDIKIILSGILELIKNDNMHQYHLNSSRAYQNCFSYEIFKRSTLKFLNLTQ